MRSDSQGTSEIQIRWQTWIRKTHIPSLHRYLNLSGRIECIRRKKNFSRADSWMNLRMICRRVSAGSLHNYDHNKLAYRSVRVNWESITRRRGIRVNYWRVFRHEGFRLIELGHEWSGFCDQVKMQAKWGRMERILRVSQNAGEVSEDSTFGLGRNWMNTGWDEMRENCNDI